MARERLDLGHDAAVVVLVGAEGIPSGLGMPLRGHHRKLPIDRCSRRIVPQLERAGYEVRYREFEGGHVVPPAIARQAARWFAKRS